VNPLQYWNGFFVFLTMNKINTQILGILLAILSANFFSSKVLLVKWAYADGLSPMEVLSLRMAVALPLFLVLTVYVLRKREGEQPQLSDYLGMAGLGMIGYYLSSVLDFHGIQYITAGMERLLLYLYPSFLVVIRCIGTRTRPGLNELVALFLAYAGAALVYMDENGGTSKEPLIGSILVLGAALCFAIYMYFSARYIERFGSRFFASFSTSVSCVAILVHGALVAERSLLEAPPAAIAICLAMGIVCTFFSTLAMHQAIAMIGSTRVGILGTSGILCPLILGILLFNEPITLNRIVGTILILVSVVSLTLKKPG
jgi:drug/metabolite transporter (DMT)-like permease